MDPTGTPPRRASAAQVARSLRASRHEAAYSAAMGGLTEPFVIPYALALGATPLQAGLLTSARNLLLALVQLLSGAAVAAGGSRKRVVLATAGLQAALLVPLAFLRPLFGDGAVVGLVVLYTVGTAAASLGAPAWGSLVAEYLAPGERGRFFGDRARWSGLWATVASMAGGLVLQLSRGGLVGFGLLMLGAAASRAASFAWLARFHEEPWHEHPQLRFSLVTFLRRARLGNFARFALCLAAFNFATQLAAPYFAIYMLEELHFGYASYTAVVLAGSVTGFTASRWWGAVGDEAGNRAVLRWTVVGTSLLPVLWLASDSVPWLLLMNVAGAFLWAGLNLSSVNFLYDACSPPRRHTCLAWFNVLNGLGIAAGAFCGGLVTSAVPLIDRSGYATVFCASAALRLAAGVAFRTWVREVREVRPVGLREVMLDFFGQRVEQVLGYFSVAPEIESGPRRRTRSWRRPR